ncbi:hypothetical protein sce5837 [Sorangium cellulosum So ce56]|uniref:Cytochrome c domain-containing protein n=1 Tax=Sorangium cellulosum (strain So ce56) TaxID=448385 RepID=A9G8J1_SORC5|nr:hypothetical protein [Sorangium cellulosum]CAN96000.1 hypothetical protein sce5837 [Sorangium cellulosum So ce56]
MKRPSSSIYRSALMILASAAHLSCTATAHLKRPSPPPSPPENTGASSPVDDETCRTELWSKFPSFTDKLCSALPRDIDPELQKSTIGRGEYAEGNRLYDILAWQSFIAMAWPVTKDGRARPRLADDGAHGWDTWKTSYDVFKPGGGAPDAWNPAEQQAKRSAPDASFPINASRTLQDDRQADSFILWDQNGNKVYYEVLYSERLFKYLNDNALYSIDGQIAYSAEYCATPEEDCTNPDAPWGNPQNADQTPSIALKLAWKLLDESESHLEGRFILRKAYVRAGAAPSLRTFGLVGANVMIKTLSAKKQWVWAAFEHIDNVDVNPLETHNGKPLKPSFNDPDCPLCPVNEPPDERVWPPSEGPWVSRTQVHRQQPIREDTAALNSEVQAQLKKNRSALQFYELVGTQWPTDGGGEPSPSDRLPDAVANESGGRPYRPYLVNTVLETYMQKGNTVAADVNRALRPETTRMFHTSSCMGCHSGAHIARERSQGKITWGERGSGDFLWSYATKARPKAAPAGDRQAHGMTSAAEADAQPKQRK